MIRVSGCVFTLKIQVFVLMDFWRCKLDLQKASKQQLLLLLDEYNFLLKYKSENFLFVVNIKVTFTLSNCEYELYDVSLSLKFDLFEDTTSCKTGHVGP